jgi:hypothetical protein
MCDGFSQFDGAVHRVNLPSSWLDATTFAAVGTLRFFHLLECHISGPRGLNHLAQLLTDFVRRELDLIVVGRPRALLVSLNLSGDFSRLLQ